MLARRLAGVTTRLVISERSHLSTNLAHSGWCKRLASTLSATPDATCLSAGGSICCGPDGVADDLARTSTFRQAITRIYNHTPSQSAGQGQRSHRASLVCVWRSACGALHRRLGRQKDFPLIASFARVRATRPLRLIISRAASDPDEQGQSSGQVHRPGG